MGGLVMGKKTFLVGALLFFALSCTLAFAKKHISEERGKAHFNSSTFAGGKKSCSACHPDGSGLKNAGTKTSFAIMGGQQESLEEAIYVCIVNANKGKALDVNSAEMQEIASYIKSLAGQ
jgi:cytochrome c